MGQFLGKLFVDPSSLPGGDHCGFDLPFNVSTSLTTFVDCDEKGFGFFQVLTLFVAYGYILFLGSNMISDGSELLLLVPSLKGVVGSIVLPVLGAVPDGAIILFSALGDDAQAQVSIGVGALAGSTIMLLTVPWLLSIVAGRVELDASGQPQYSKKSRRRLSVGSSEGMWSRMSANLFHTGVSPDGALRNSARIMLATSLIYLVIQGPAFEEYHKNGQANISDNASGIQPYAIVGFSLCLIAFVAYLVYQAKYADVSDSVDKVTREAIGKRLISLSGAFAASLPSTGDESSTLLEDGGRLKTFLRSFYHRYDVNRDGRIDKAELKLLLNDLNESMSPERFEQVMAEMDKDKNGFIEFEEFVDAMSNYMSVSTDSADHDMQHQLASLAVPAAASESEGIQGDEEEDGDEEEELPEEFKPLSPQQQQRAIKLRAAWMLGMGSFLVLLFSDPMVDVLDDIAGRVGVPPFYVAFVLAPVASNASELIAAFNYASKKTKKTITISLVTLAGAATMNNTFSLGIFLLLIFVRKLAWEFSAETLSILVIQLVMVLMMHKPVHRLIDGVAVIMLYPLCLVMVALLEGPGGLN